MAKLLVSYRRGSRRSGVWMAVFYVLIVAGFISFPRHCLSGLPTLFCYLWDGFFLGCGALVIFGYSIPNIVMNREFRFELFEDRIECKSPARVFGESYSIPVSDIVALKESCHENAVWDWCLVTRDNRTIPITPSYGNPVGKIVKALRQLNPDLPVRRV